MRKLTIGQINQLARHELWVADPKTGKRLNWSRKDLRNLDLSGHNLSGAKLSGADLTGANLESCNLMGCDLSYALLYKTKVKNSRIKMARLKGVEFNKPKPIKTGGRQYTAAEITEAATASMNEIWQKYKNGL